jgi:tRNA pseudouridine-54 N-methylase
VVAAPDLIVALVRLHFPEGVDVPDRIFRQQKSCIAVIIYSITFLLPCLSNWCPHDRHTTMTEKKRELRGMIDEAVKGKIDASRRFVDEVLEKIQDRNRQYFLERLGSELRQMELEQKAGNMHGAMHHRVMADTYKSILEKCFC